MRRLLLVIDIHADVSDQNPISDHRYEIHK